MSAAVVIMLLLGTSLPADEVARQAEADFDKGVSAWENGEPSRGHFRASAEGYEELRRQGIRNPALERNLGNARFMSDDLPRAILAYRRGLKLAPSDRGLLACLGEARRRVVRLDGSTLGRPPESQRPTWLPHIPRTLFAIILVGYSLFCLAVARWFMLRRGRWLLVAAAGLLVAVGASVLLYFDKLDSDGAIVVVAEDGVFLRRGNGEAYPARYDVPLNRGVEARLLHRIDDWLQIELAGGEVGWISQREAVVE